MGTRKRPRVCCLAIDLWRIIKKSTLKNTFLMVPLFTPPRIVSSKKKKEFFFPRFGVCTEKGLEEKGEKEAKKCVRIQLIKNNCPKNIYILLTFYTKTSFDSIESLEYE